jgi:hypothetical protein
MQEMINFLKCINIYRIVGKYVSPFYFWWLHRSGGVSLCSVSTGSLPHMFWDVWPSSCGRCQCSTVLKTGQRNNACTASVVNGRVLQLWTKEEVQAVVHYEWARGTPGTDIHSRLVEVYGPDVMSIQMVWRWCQQFQDGCMSVLDDAGPGPPTTAVGEDNITRRVEDLIQWDRRVTVGNVTTEVGISHASAHKLVHDILWYCKVSSRWVPCQLTPDHEVQ